LADLVTIEPSKDNTLYEDVDGLKSNGAGWYLFAGSTESFGARRAVLEFDIAAAVPPLSTINSVELDMNLSRCGPSCFTTVPMDLHRLLAAWGEGTSDAGQPGGNGAPSAPGDATWIHTFYDTAFWASPGGDYSPTVSMTRNVSGLGSYTWSSTPQAVADVQSWLDSPATNYGWIIIGDESLLGAAKRFDSREHPTAAVRPRLRIDYTPIPEPATILFLGLGLAAVYRGRTR